MQYCVVCKTPFGGKVKSHCFPRDKAVRASWMSALKISKIQPCHRICSKHFSTADYVRGKLRRQAVPMVYKPGSPSKTNKGGNKGKQSKSVDNKKLVLKKEDMERENSDSALKGNVAENPQQPEEDIIKSLNYVELPNHLIVRSIIIDRNGIPLLEIDRKTVEVQTVNKVANKGTTTEIELKTKVNVGIQHNQQASKMKLPTVTKAIQCNLDAEICESSSGEKSDSEDELFYSTPPVKNYENKCRYLDGEMYECVECGKAMVKSTLLLHVRGHDEKSVLCQYCGKTFSTKITLTSHEKNVHEKIKEEPIEQQVFSKAAATTKEQRICPYCNRLSKSYLIHLDHLNSHTGERPHICSCGSRFRCVFNLYAHRKQFGCPAKGSYSPYVKSIEIENAKEKRKKKKKKPNDYKYKKRSRKKKNKNVGAFEATCEVCNKTFRNKEYFQRHKASHNDRCFACPECSHSFPTATMLKTHIKHMHLDRVKCKICKAIVCKSRYKIHERFHKKEKPFACDECDKKFSVLYMLRVHKQKVHEGIQVLNPVIFTCLMCNKTETGPRKTCYRKHLKRTDHMLNEKRWMKEHDIKNYPCDFCVDTFSTYWELCFHSWRCHRKYIYNNMGEIIKKLGVTLNENGTVCEKEFNNMFSQSDENLEICAVGSGQNDTKYIIKYLDEHSEKTDCESIAESNDAVKEISGTNQLGDGSKGFYNERKDESVHVNAKKENLNC